jgi:hypothetical protein
MGHTNPRTALLQLAVDAPHMSNQTLKRSLDLLAFLEIEEVDITGITCDEWGAVTFAFAPEVLPSVAVRGQDVTACSDDADDPVAKLVNAITASYEADELVEEEEDEDE